MPPSFSYIHFNSFAFAFLSSPLPEIVNNEKYFALSLSHSYIDFNLFSSGLPSTSRIELVDYQAYFPYYLVLTTFISIHFL